ncbi:MAG TPA: tRNA dihydrouridine(20/20a) synthase DusA [Alphaproteobacteria bacterium]|nr:tRNA dihydrouridine(20/20a) synthase DusA [Alphaproteobacteria bacterium]
MRAAGPSRRLSVAPMMDRTDRHCRYFLRLLTKRTLLYSEMITTGAVLRGDRARLLGFDPAERPLALQLGGSDPDALAECARIGEAFGYDEINLNLGCPSDRVQAARFGACLMAEPALVASSIRAMTSAVKIPVTVKTRIGIDRHESYEALEDLVRRLADAGAASFAIHARKAWLDGLSPKENREIPPLRYDVVHRLKRDNPALETALNGGIETLDQAAAQLETVDGVMIGRAAYRDPYMLAAADRRFFDRDAPVPTRADVAARFAAYAEAWLARGTPLHALTRHMLGLYQGVAGARTWRRRLSVDVHLAGAGAALIRDASAEAEEAAAALACARAAFAEVPSAA